MLLVGFAQIDPTQLPLPIGTVDLFTTTRKSPVEVLADPLRRGPTNT